MAAGRTVSGKIDNKKVGQTDLRGKKHASSRKKGNYRYRLTTFTVFLANFQFIYFFNLKPLVGLITYIRFRMSTSKNVKNTPKNVKIL